MVLQIYALYRANAVLLIFLALLLSAEAIISCLIGITSFQKAQGSSLLLLGTNMQIIEGLRVIGALVASQPVLGAIPTAYNDGYIVYLEHREGSKYNLQG